MTRTMDRQMQNLESMPGGQVWGFLSIMQQCSILTAGNSAANVPRCSRTCPQCHGRAQPFSGAIWLSGILFSTFSTSQDLRGQTAAPAPTPSTETTAPAPNPWAPQGSQAPPATSGTSATPQGPGLGAALGQGGGMFTSPGMQSLMGQMRLVCL